MGIEISLKAVRRDNLSDETCLYFDQLTRVGEVLLTWCRSAHAPVFTTDDGMPHLVINPQVWDSFMELLSGKAELIRYLTGYVTATYNDEGIIPVAFRDLHDLSLRRVRAFDAWHSVALGYPRFLPNDDAPAEQSELEDAITQAFILQNWMASDPVLQPYLLDEDYMVLLSISSTDA